jgi:hypothetical protein
MPGRVYNVLHTFALDQGGYLTIRQAQGSASRRIVWR